MDAKMNGNSEKSGELRTTDKKTADSGKTAPASAGERLRRRASDIWRRICAASAELSPTLPGKAALAAAAFLLGRATVWGARPFGFALLAAAPNGVPFIMTGLLLSALTLGKSEGVILAAVCLLTTALRLTVRALIDPPGKKERLRDSAFGENIYLRMATASVAAFTAGLWKLATGGFYFYDLRGAIISMILAPVAAGIIEPIFRRRDFYTDSEPCHERHGASDGVLRTHYKAMRERAAKGRFSLSALEYSSLRYDAALAAVLFCAVLSLRADSVAGFSLGHAAASLLVLAAARRRSLGRSVGFGLLCGAALGWLWAPAYAAAAASAWAMFRVSSVGGASIAALVISLCGLFFDGFSGILTVLPAALTGMALFCTADAALLSLKHTSKTEDGNAFETDAAPALVDARERLGELSDAFGELSAAFSELSECRRRPGEAELRRIADETSDEFCSDCPERQRCWELEYDSTLSAFCALAESALRGGRGTIRTDGRLPARCAHLPDISERMKTLAAAGLRRTLEDERLSFFACDYRAVASILADAAESNRREHSPDPAASDLVKQKLEEMGVKSKSVSVIGERRLRIEAVGADLTRCRTRVCDLRRTLETAVGVPLTDPSFVMGQDEPVLTLRARRRLNASFSAARGAPDGGVCGDTVCRLENRNDYFYAFICDGMGKGSEAAFTAGVCGVFLKRMLSAQNSVETSLRLLNSIIRGKGGEECSAGVDLLEIDLLTGKAALYKGGAAPSYLRRGDKIYSLSSQSVPLGIIGELDAGKTEFSVEPGDIILMVSDGVLAGTDEDADGSYVWLLDLLSSCDARSLEDTARRALRMARIAGSRDDASAAVIAIAEEPARGD